MSEKKSASYIDGYVYFIQIENGGPIKIGWATDVLTRLAQIQTACPYQVNPLAAVPADFEDEAKYHRQFSAHRLNGEWFAPAPELVALIETLPPIKRAISRKDHINSILVDPETTQIWFSSSIETDIQAGRIIGLSTSLLRAALGRSGRKTGTKGKVAKVIGALGGSAKGTSAAKARDDLVPSEQVREILSRPGMTYDRAAELLGGKPFSASTLRRHFPGYCGVKIK